MKNKEILDTFSQKETMYKMAKKVTELSEGVIKKIKITLETENETIHSELKVKLFWECGEESQLIYSSPNHENSEVLKEIKELLNPLKKEIDKEIKEVCDYCYKINVDNPDDLIHFYEEKYG